VNTITEHWHGFDFAGWQVSADATAHWTTGPLLTWGGSWRDMTICIGRWTVYIGRDRRTPAERKAARGFEAQEAWISAGD